MITFAQTCRGDSRIDEIGNDPATLFRPIFLKPCRGRRPRRPGNERIFNLQPAMIGSHVKSKICCFPDRRGRRSLQAKIQTASTRRYGAKTLSFPVRFKAIAVSVYGDSIFHQWAFFSKGSPWGELPPQVGERGIR